jgi:uncharacterized protein YdaU (DUF1376 family)
MSKDPAVLFYTGDFINGCACLTLEERGQYITLLCLQHLSGHLSEKTIRLTVGSVSVDVISKFKVDDDGLFFNERMDEEIKKRMQYLDSRRNNGSNGGRPKKPYAKPYEKAYQNHSENENINENDINNEEEIASILSFEDFWDLYDKKVGDKGKLIKKYDLISEVDRSVIKEHLPLYKSAQPDKKFRKDPMTYLNNHSWNDEIIESNGNKGTTNRRNNPAGDSNDESIFCGRG